MGILDWLGLGEVIQVDESEMRDRLTVERTLRKISNKIHSSSLEEILSELGDELKGLLGAERVTIYAVDRVKHEIFSKVKSGDELNEIRVPISPASLAGYVAHTGRVLAIADAYDAKREREDHISQALYLQALWQEIYEQSYDKGRVGNAIGGLIFQWSDGWWKYRQEVNLDVHDTTASWSNEAYQHDWTPDGNNMNEEWFGICAKGKSDDKLFALTAVRDIDDPKLNKSIRKGLKDKDVAVVMATLDTIAHRGDTEALKDLSDDHRTAIALVFFRGLTLRQAGERMGGRTEDAVRMLLRRAENRLREITRTRLS